MIRGSKPCCIRVRTTPKCSIPSPWRQFWTSQLQVSRLGLFSCECAAIIDQNFRVDLHPSHILKVPNASGLFQMEYLDSSEIRRTQLLCFKDFSLPGFLFCSSLPGYRCRRLSTAFVFFNVSQRYQRSKRTTLTAPPDSSRAVFPRTCLQGDRKQPDNACDIVKSDMFVSMMFVSMKRIPFNDQ